MATRTQTTVANCAWNRMGRVAQPKPCILGLTLGLWRAHEFNRAASAASRGYSGMLCEWSVGGPCGVHCTLQGAGVWALRASDWPSVTLYNVYSCKLISHKIAIIRECPVVLVLDIEPASVVFRRNRPPSTGLRLSQYLTQPVFVARPFHACQDGLAHRCFGVFVRDIC